MNNYTTAFRPLQIQVSADDEDENTKLNEIKSFRFYRNRKAIGWSIFLLICVIVGFSYVFHINDISDASGATDSVLISTIEKSPNDERKYKYITLKKNSLSALLIQDPESDKSGAALSVRIGSMSNPTKWAGLAHFLEHMLFMGSDVDSDENAYSNFLAMHNGRSNAYTAQEETNYYFDIEKKSLYGALRLFSGFFTSPLLKSDAVSREVQAVNNEHEKNIENDDWRSYQMLKNAANPSNPYHDFSTGNLETLNKTGVHEALIEFYDMYYSANIMRLVVYGSDTIDQLENWVLELFDGVPNTFVKVPSWLPSTPYSQGYLGKRYFIVPVDDKDMLSLVWQLPSQQHLYLSNPAGYVSSLIGTETDGSIISYLRGKGWATGLLAGLSENLNDFSLFGVDIQLTPSGLEHVEEVIGCVFQYIRLVIDEGIQKVYWEENQKIREISWNFIEKQSASSTASGLASRMHRFSSFDVLGSPLRSVFKAHDVSNILSVLTPERVIVQQTSRSYLEKPPISAPIQTEPIYKIRYQEETISESNLDLWNDKVAPVTAFYLPIYNPYIPSNLSLLPLPTDGNKFPEQINKNNIRLWYKQDDIFRVPKVNVVVALYSDVIYESPLNYVLANIWMDIVRDNLRQDLFLASMSGLNLDLIVNHKGILLKLVGYQEHAGKLLMKAAETLTSVSITDISFENAKISLRSVEESSSQPYEQALGMRKYLLSKPQYSRSNILKALYQVKKSQLFEFSKVVVSKVAMEILVVGNTKQETAVDWAAGIFEALKSSSLPWTKIPYESTIQSPATNTLIQMRNNNTADINDAVLNTYDVGIIDGELKKHVVLILIGEMIREPCFNQLRTIEQLGYIVFCFANSMNGVGSIDTIVQSSSTPASVIDERVEIFLQDYYQNTLSPMTTAIFNEFKSSVENKLNKKPLSLSELTDQYWGSIASSHRLEVDFELNMKLTETLKSVQINDAVDFYKRYVIGDIEGSSHPRKLGIEVFSQDSEITAPTGRAKADSIIDVKDTLEWRGKQSVY